MPLSFLPRQLFFHFWKIPKRLLTILGDHACKLSLPLPTNDSYKYFLTLLDLTYIGNHRKPAFQSKKEVQGLPYGPISPAIRAIDIKSSQGSFLTVS